jgi:dTDP-4-amino-4,6-dideoxygalactose transaminase
MNKIALFQNERNWQQIRNQVFDLVDQDSTNGQAQNTRLVGKLEQRLAELYNRRYCITTASCTDALIIALTCLNLPLGSVVAVSNYTFVATAHAVARAGYCVHPVDVNSNYCIDASQIPTTARAVVVADMFGNMSDWSALQKLNIPVINDAAQSMESWHGAYSASFGDISCVSFSPSKPISSWGSGGALFTDDIEVALKAKALRLHGRYNKQHTSYHAGMNSMISGFEAACIWAALDRSEQWRDRRQYIVNHLISACKLPAATDQTIIKHGHQKLVFQSFDRDGYLQHLLDHNVSTAVHYNNLINDEPLYKSFNELHTSSQLKEVSFTVPNQHSLTDEEVEHIAKALK